MTFNNRNHEDAQRKALLTAGQETQEVGSIMLNIKNGMYQRIMESIQKTQKSSEDAML